jgi:sister chromatid cohesion protein PDS5
MIDIMVSLIESCESISTSLLESILEPLLLKEMQSSYHLSKVLLSRTVDYIVSNLNEYIVGELNNLDKEKPKFKVKRSHIFNIIIQLNDISSKFLLYIMPTIAFQLKDEDVEIRSAIILLLSRMFSSKESTLIQDYNEIFGEFLARFNDIDSTIRIHMVKSMIDLVKNHPNYTMEKVNKYLGERIMDVDEKVRRNVVETVCQIATFSHSYVTNDLMIQVGERMRQEGSIEKSHNNFVESIVQKLLQCHSTR